MSEEVDNLIKVRVKKLYESLMEKPLQVLGIFNNFFGEERVDMQGYPELNEFSSWMSTSPIYTYYTNRNAVSMSGKEWDMYGSLPITELPITQVNEIVDSFGLTSIKDNIGNSQFGNIFILVHFPHVRVTNEHDRFVDINHLWAKVKVMYNGTLTGGFTLNRSEYTPSHFISDYMHSHISSIPKSDFTMFQTPCTGSGPINATIVALNRNFDEDIWNMFCLELSKYVTVESIAGRPYKYLENIGTENMEVGENSFISYVTPYFYSDSITRDKLREFIRHFIATKKLKFNYVNGCYSIGMSLIEYIVLISNEFISWYNDQFNKSMVTKTFEQLKSSRLLEECIIDNGKIYFESQRRNVNNCQRYIGKKMCMFKGKEIIIDIIDVAGVRNENKSIILNIQTSLYILNVILKVLNYRYGRETAAHEDGQFGTEVRYL